ncbi:MAG TPA: response regulator transcription factor [Acidimicrobiales bacterium]|nr:response regulator transcription factor [Acidimicrobiales bacterium]MDP7118071.1 response regulator transcription factor [Acidimicrobiales bacterium]MDP7411963.1 response regulator transcription factor [Acidimicrobiales bacterium]MEE1523075.1 response regulator transcription factor [Acidimicrobiales bacterium]HJL83536.1 response regulator transcription factor [Acidimicrobiales bacterium]
MGEPVRVFLLDDHEIVRRGVVAVIDAEPDMEVVGEAGTVAEALEVVQGCSPDVAVLDIRLGEGSGVEVCRDIRSQYPDVKCLMLTSFEDDQALVEASLAGAAGYVLKQVQGGDLLEAIRMVADGRVLLDRATTRLALRRLRESGEATVGELPPQERRVFELIGDGLSNREIAEEMILAEKTIKNYVTSLLQRLGMQRRTEAAAFAARLDERRRGG